MTKLKIPLNETRFKNKTYAAIIREIERLEHKDAYRGNGHHLSQRIVDMLWAAFENDLEDWNSGGATTSTNTTRRTILEEIGYLEYENAYLSDVIDNVREASRQRGSVVAGQAVCEIIHDHDHNIRPNATDTATKLRAYFEMQEARINDLTQIIGLDKDHEVLESLHDIVKSWGSGVGQNNNETLGELAVIINEWHKRGRSYSNKLNKHSNKNEGNMKELTEYTDEEKIKWFDMMYNDAREQFICIKNTGTTHKDAEHYTWETVIELLGEGIWVEWNSHC